MDPATDRFKVQVRFSFLRRRGSADGTAFPSRLGYKGGAVFEHLRPGAHLYDPSAEYMTPTYVLTRSTPAMSWLMKKEGQSQFLLQLKHQT